MDVLRAGGLPPGTDVISCAIGVLIERYQCSDVTARAYLLELADGGQIQPYDAAGRVLDSVRAGDD